MDYEIIDKDKNLQTCRATTEQIRAVIEFMQKNPDLANSKMRDVSNRHKLWIKLSNIVNAIPGSVKSSQGWNRYWNDKKYLVKMKKSLIDRGKGPSALSPMEEQIWNIISNDKITPRKRKNVKKEVLEDDIFNDTDDDETLAKHAKNDVNDVEGKQMLIMDELLQVMDRQATALDQIAQASTSNAEAMNKLAEASIAQARAVEALSNTIGTMGAVVQDVRNAIMDIDYTLKRCYNINPT